MSSLISLLNAKPDPLVIPGTAPVASNLPQMLKQCSKELEKLAIDQENISAHVYSRSAKPETAHVKHKGWKGEIFRIQSSLAALERAVTAQYTTNLPFLEAHALKEAFELRLRLIDRIQSIKEDNEPLTKIISAQNYLEAHTFCKTAIKECEAATSVEALEKLFEKKKAEIVQRETKIASLKDPYLPHHIRKLHRNVKDFFSHRIQAFHAPKNDIEATSEPKNPPKTASDLPELKYVLAYSDYIRSFTRVTLDPLYGFQNASWFGTELYQEIAYKPIWKQIEGLKEVAKGIQPLMQDVQHAIDALRVGNSSPREGCKDLAEQVHFFEEVHLHLENSLKKEKNALLDSTLTTEVHTGLYYAERLLHALSKIRHKIRTLSRLSTEGSAFALSLQQRVITYLDKKNSTNSSSCLGEVRAFFDACQHLVHIPPPTKDASKYIVQFIRDSRETAQKILAVMGQSTTKQVLKADDVCKFLIHKTPLSAFCSEFSAEKQEDIPNQLKVFIEKELCRWIYYSNNKSCSFLLSLVIALLENDSKFKNALDNSLLADTEFKLLMTTYKQLAKPTNEEQALLDNIVLASNILSLPYSKNESPFFYGKAATLIATLDAKLTQELDKEVSETIEMTHRHLEQRRESTRSAFRYPIHLTKNELKNESLANATDQEELTSRLFSFLTLALWGSPFEKTEATATIRSYFATRDEPLPELGPTKYLLFLFSITNPKNLSKVEQEILPSFFTEYLRNDSFAESFAKQFNLPAIERLLETLVSANKHLEQTIQECRGTTGFEAWKKAVDHSKKFETLTISPPPSWLRYEQELDEHIKAVAKLKADGGYVKAMTAILEEIKKTRESLK